MIETKNMEHPEICFGISRHNVIIPLKIVDLFDYEDGCFQYTFEINHPKPTDYMKCHHKADFDAMLVTADAPLGSEFTKIRLTLEEAKELVTKQLRADRNSAMMKVNSIDKSLAKIDADIAELESAIKKGHSC
jgi:hypothetical protein